VAVRTPIKGIDEEIAELVALVREAQVRVGEVQDEVRPVIEAAKLRLKMLLGYRGSNWSDEDGYARIVSDGLRTSYDAKALDKLILDDPETYGWLRQYRQETPVRGGVSVK
jgi:hypothetical protein